MLLGDFDISVSYDRTGNILIGMDILKNLDIHIGTNAEGRTVLLATKQQRETEAFRAELAQLFDVKKLI